MCRRRVKTNRQSRVNGGKLISNRLTQQSIAPRADLREMLRKWIVSRSLGCMEVAADKRREATASAAASAEYRATIRNAVDALAAKRDRQPDTVRRAAADIAGVSGPGAACRSEVGEPFQVWSHDWRSVMLHPEHDIELPATLLTTRGRTPAPTRLHIDDSGRNRLLARGGPLTAAIRFLDRDRPVFNLLTVDLRGWGDTAPAMYPYEMAGWGGIDRYLAYATAAREEWPTTESWRPCGMRQGPRYQRSQTDGR